MSDPHSNVFRQFVRNISPTWLNGSVSGSFMYSMAILFDALSDGASYAVRARFLTIAPPDALTWFQQDRQIDPGPNESTSSFTARLLIWLDLWRLAGTDFSILLALLAYLTPNSLAVSIVSASGTWNLYPAGAASSLSLPPTWAGLGLWNWDGNADPFYARPQHWWRSWLIIYDPTNLMWKPTPKWGDGHRWGDGTCWGYNGTASQGASIRALVKKWKQAGVQFPQIIISFDSTWFQPGNVPGAKSPDGTWGHWGKVAAAGGWPRAYIASRNPVAIYADGII